MPPESTRSPDIDEKLRQHWSQREEGYKPRTKHLEENGEPKYINRLFLESSPYLLQHAHNPVDWRPWNDDSLKAAKDQNKLIFLSVGYATCHWCHVMEEESFEDEEIAAYLNSHYIPIKVDREERPDIDAIYMRAIRALTGRGGWPISIWLTPDGEPFGGETYIPPKDGDRGRSVGFLSMLKSKHIMFEMDPNDTYSQATSLSARVKRSMARPIAGLSPTSATLEAAFKLAKKQFDPINGGRIGQPKFPSSFPLPFMIQRGLYGDKEASRMAIKTLDKMRQGGIYDQVGHGFHRYSVDGQWHVPHFEKMLYDNAQLALDYARASRLPNASRFTETARNILDYMRRDMTRPEGGFYSATDADSLTPTGEREEGRYFTWTPSEVEAALSVNESKLAIDRFGINAKGNIEGRTTLNQKRSLQTLARKTNRSAADVKSDLETIRKKLYAYRSKRNQPLLDDKLIVAWNGLAISAFAKGGFLLQRQEDIAIAVKAADFILENMLVDGKLMRIHAKGKPSHLGTISDHSFFIAALLDLFEVQGEKRWIEAAMKLDENVVAEFEHPEGGWYRTAKSAPPLLVRDTPSYDGAEPSGTSIMTLNLLRLNALTTVDKYRKRAEKAMKTHGRRLNNSPLAMDDMLTAIHWKTHKPKEIFIIGPTEKSLSGLKRTLSQAPLKNRVFVFLTDDKAKELESIIPPLKGKRSRDDRATAYVCQGGACQSPTTDPLRMRQLVSE